MTGLAPELVAQFVGQIEMLVASGRPRGTGDRAAVAVETILALADVRQLHRGVVIGDVAVCAPDCPGCDIRRLGEALSRHYDPMG